MCEGGERDGRHINTNRFREGKNGTKIIIDNVNGGHEGVGEDNGVKKSVDSGKGGCVGPYFVVYLYSVSSYRPSHSTVHQSFVFVPKQNFTKVFLLLPPGSCHPLFTFPYPFHLPDFLQPACFSACLLLFSVLPLASSVTSTAWTWAS